MYITINEEKISMDFNPNIRVTVSGPDNYYYVEVREFKKNEEKSLYVEGFSITDKEHIEGRNFFTCPIDFYYDFEVTIYKYVDKVGLIKIFSHRYNDNGKLVLFNLDTLDYDECLLWVDRVKEYQLRHGCKIAIKTNFNHINKRFESFYYVNNIDYYKTYNIGRFSKASRDWRTIDPRKEGLIWFGNWKTFWSYQHPRPFKGLSSQEIIDDILGL